MPIMPDWSGQYLADARLDPQLVLAIYNFGAVITRQTENGGKTEYTVDPLAVASAFKWKPKWNSGLLPPHLLYVAANGTTLTTATYREPQPTGIYLKDSDKPIRIPMPGLVLIRHTNAETRPTYWLFAAKERPTQLETPLYVAPLTHIYHNGSICWGSVAFQDTYNPERPYDFVLAWQALLGSRFGYHIGTEASRKYKGDIHKMWIRLEEQGAKEYPTDDLIQANQTLDQVLNDLEQK